VQFCGFEKYFLFYIEIEGLVQTGTPTEHTWSISVILRITSNTNTHVMMINNPEFF